MNTTLWTLLRAFQGIDSAQACRRCSDPIPRTDAFGISEGVCPPCRQGDEN
jgi:hypothetical protein